MRDSKGRPSKFRISLVNHPDPNNPEHWDLECSVREARAVRRARRLVTEGHKDAMLFKQVPVRDPGTNLITGHQLVRISIRPRKLNGK